MNGPQLVSFWRSILLAARTTQRDRRAAIVPELVEDAGLDANYLALILGSCTIATLGLLENSSAVIIGAMIVAPLMPVIQALAFGALEGSATVLRRSALTLAVGIAVALAFSAGIAHAVGLAGYGSEILARTRPNLLDLGIAIAAGAVGGFARIRPSVANAVAGTAVAVALMPPLCVVGIGLAEADPLVARGAGLLFLTNLIGITLASMAVFLLAGLASRHAAPALAWTAGLTAVMLVPLGLSLRTLVRETALENALRQALTTKTATFRQATLVSSSFDWLTSPPQARLLVRSSEMLSAHQVELLEAFAERATGQHFRLVIDVSTVARVTSRSANASDLPASALLP